MRNSEIITEPERRTMRQLWSRDVTRRQVCQKTKNVSLPKSADVDLGA